MKHTYSITGMHCQSCVAKTTAALRTVPGITSAEVTLDPPQAHVEMSQHVPTETLDAAVRAAGDYRLADQETASPPQAAPAEKESLFPLFLIVAYIAGTVGVIMLASESPTLRDAMRYFMAGFFLVFSFFKLLDLKGFAETYRTYDILARARPAWAFIYPFAELALGLAYAANFWPIATNVATLMLMLVGAVGVLKALLAKRSIRCACLGTVLNLPMTTVTLIEDVTMAAMAAVMLLTHAWGTT